jgi:hypothetical protein
MKEGIPLPEFPLEPARNPQKNSFTVGKENLQKSGVALPTESGNSIADPIPYPA